MADIPIHLGIIPDGNRRWGEDNGVPKIKAYERGYKVMIQIAQEALNKGVKYLTGYAFSTENWDRPPDEVGYIMNLMLRAAINEVDELDQNNIRMRFIGSREGLDPKLVKAIEEAEQRTTNNTKGTLGLCFNYGGQHEIIDAVKTIVATGVDTNSLTPESFNQYLYSPDIPPVDLIIRTSGEHRLSGFMLWRSAYSEFYFVDKHWPDFDADDLNNALGDYATRHRRFGK